MGKTRDLFKKIRDTKGTFHAKMGSKKDRNGMDLTEAEDIKKRWHEYAEELYKKDLYDSDNHDAATVLVPPPPTRTQFPREEAVPELEGWGFGGRQGGGFRIGNTCIPVADSFRYLAKPIQ